MAKLLKKGIFFTIDSIIAAGIILVVVLLAYSFYIKEEESFQLNYLSRDLVKTLSTVTVEEIDNGYVNTLIADGTISNRRNSVLGQISEFWADGEVDLANKTASNVTDPLVPEIFGVGIWIDDESIYQRDLPIEKSLVSSKKIVSGIKKGKSGSLGTRQDPPALLGPILVEVRVWQ